MNFLSQTLMGIFCLLLPPHSEAHRIHQKIAHEDEEEVNKLGILLVFLFVIIIDRANICKNVDYHNALI